MLKLFVSIYTLTSIVCAVQYWDCEQRAFCNRYRKNLIWGKPNSDDVKLNSQYNVDHFTVNDETSSISIGLSHNLTALNTTIADALIPTDFFEEHLQAELTFYANGAMRVEVNDASNGRF